MHSFLLVLIGSLLASELLAVPAQQSATADAAAELRGNPETSALRRALEESLKADPFFAYADFLARSDEAKAAKVVLALLTTAERRALTEEERAVWEKATGWLPDAQVEEAFVRCARIEPGRIDFGRLLRPGSSPELQLVAFRRELETAPAIFAAQILEECNAERATREAAAEVLLARGSYDDYEARAYLEVKKPFVPTVQPGEVPLLEDSHSMRSCANTIQLRIEDPNAWSWVASMLSNSDAASRRCAIDALWSGSIGSVNFTRAMWDRPDVIEHLRVIAHGSLPHDELQSIFVILSKSTRSLPDGARRVREFLAGVAIPPELERSFASYFGPRALDVLDRSRAIDLLVGAAKNSCEDVLSPCWIVKDWCVDDPEAIHLLLADDIRGRLPLEAMAMLEQFGESPAPSVSTPAHIASAFSQDSDDQLRLEVLVAGPDSSFLCFWMACMSRGAPAAGRSSMQLHCSRRTRSTVCSATRSAASSACCEAAVFWARALSSSKTAVTSPTLSCRSSRPHRCSHK